MTDRTSTGTTMTDGLPADATLIDALARGIEDGLQSNSGIETPPVVLLWPDPDGDFAPYIPALRQARPVLTLGDWDPDAATGPAYWLRFELDRLPADIMTGEATGTGVVPVGTPVVYLPGVSRSAFHDAEHCPLTLRPLFALQFSGRIWGTSKRLDWTLVVALRDLAGARVQAGEKHGTALRQARVKLAGVPLGDLRANAPLRDTWLLSLLIDDAPRALLRWLNDPTGVAAALGEGGLAALVDVASGQYGVDLTRLGPAEVAARLADRQGAWASVWDRFAENPTAWSGVVEQLRQAHGLTTHQPGLLGGMAPSPIKRGKTTKRPAGSFPQDNQEAESALRVELGRVAQLPPAGARNAIRHLETEHGPRRDWVWAALGRAPLAAALGWLAALAEATALPAGGPTVAAIVDSYAGGGWRADDALLRALASVSGDDQMAVAGAAVALYRSWVRDGAAALQAAWAADPPTRPEPPVGLKARGGTCVIFADGLRYDLGQRLGAELTAAGLPATVRPHLAALPTVTPTAKNAVAPVASLLAGGPDFDPSVAATGQKLSATVLRQLLRDNGWQVLTGPETGDPMDGRAWTELGQIDSYGHNAKLDVARQAQTEIDGLVDRVRKLIAAGWRTVTVVTDHGWLLLPDGFPKNELYLHLTEERKGRCARLKPGAEPEQQVVPWHWDASVGIAIAPDITSFQSGNVYDHGGLSPQEVVIPVVTVGAAQPAAAAAKIGQVTWRGLTCRVTITGAVDGLRLQLRGAAADAGTALTGVKTPKGDGTTPLLVEDEDQGGRMVWVVLFAADGTIIDQRSTSVPIT